MRDLIADRDLEAWLAVDLSPSMAFGTALAEKRSIALGAAAGVGFLTARSQNRVGAVIGTAGDRRLALPPRVGRDHLRALLTVIGSAPIEDGAGRSDLGALLHDVGGRARRRGFICVISDYLGDPESWRRPLGALVTRHEVLAIEIVDPRELDLPAVGSLVLRDASSGAVREVRVTESVRRRYAEAAAAQREAIRSAVIGAGAHHLQLRTDHDWLSELIGYVHRRRRQPATLRRGGPI